MLEANELLEEHIRDRAYFLWEKDGKPDGRAEEYWERATAEIQDARASEASVMTGTNDYGSSTPGPAADGRRA